MLKTTFKLITTNIMFLPSKLKLSLPLENPLMIYPEIAKKIGLNEAIVIQQIHYWLRQNENKTTHIINDKVWCYNSIKEWNETFVFWSKNTIIRAIDNLVKLNLIYKDNHNKQKFDKTIWYSINYQEFIKVVNQEIDVPKMGNGETQDGIKEQPKMSNCIIKTETNTKTTTETKEAISVPQPAAGLESIPQLQTQIPIQLYTQKKEKDPSDPSDQNVWAAEVLADELQVGYDEILAMPHIQRITEIVESQYPEADKQQEFLKFIVKEKKRDDGIWKTHFYKSYIKDFEAHKAVQKLKQTSKIRSKSQSFDYDYCE